MGPGQPRVWVGKQDSDKREVSTASSALLVRTACGTIERGSAGKDAPKLRNLEGGGQGGAVRRNLLFLPSCQVPVQAPEDDSLSKTQPIFWNSYEVETKSLTANVRPVQGIWNCPKPRCLECGRAQNLCIIHTHDQVY